MKLGSESPKVSKVTFARAMIPSALVHSSEQNNFQVYGVSKSHDLDLTGTVSEDFTC